MLLGKMWFSKSKPPMNIFLRPLADDVSELYSKGEFLTTVKIYFCSNLLLSKLVLHSPVAYSVANFIADSAINSGVEVLTSEGPKIVKAMLLLCSVD